MFSRRARIVWPLSVVVLAYTAGVMECAHIRLEEGRFGQDGPATRLVAASAGHYCQPVGQRDGSGPAGKKHSRKDCPICQIVAHLHVLSLSGHAPFLQQTLLIGRIAASQWRQPACDTSIHHFARGPPAETLL